MPLSLQILLAVVASVQALVAIASASIALMLYRLYRQQRHDGINRTYKDLHEGFFNDANLAKVRKYLACGQSYAPVQSVLKKRQQILLRDSLRDLLEDGMTPKERDSLHNLLHRFPKDILTFEKRDLLCGFAKDGMTPEQKILLRDFLRNLTEDSLTPEEYDILEEIDRFLNFLVRVSAVGPQFEHVHASWREHLLDYWVRRMQKVDRKDFRWYADQFFPWVIKDHNEH